jgi:hypothetical protein
VSSLSFSLSLCLSLSLSRRRRWSARTGAHSLFLSLSLSVSLSLSLSLSSDCGPFFPPVEVPVVRLVLLSWCVSWSCARLFITRLSRTQRTPTLCSACVGTAACSVQTGAHAAARLDTDAHAAAQLGLLLVSDDRYRCVSPIEDGVFACAACDTVGLSPRRTAPLGWFRETHGQGLTPRWSPGMKREPVSSD